MKPNPISPLPAERGAGARGRTASRRMARLGASLRHGACAPRRPVTTAPSATPAGGERCPGFSEIFRGQYGFVCAVLAKKGVGDADREDVAQDVFVAVNRHFDEFDPRRPIRPWLIGFARHAAMRYRKLARHRLEFAREDIVAVDVRPGADEQLVDCQSRTMVVAAIGALEERLRTVFEMSQLGEAGIREIADGLAIPLNTAYSRLRRARSLFRANLKRLEAGSRLGA